MEVQTHFTVGYDHFSQTHAQHQGCQSPLQRDLQLRTPDNKVLQTWGMPSPPGTVVQTTLNQFRPNR